MSYTTLKTTRKKLNTYENENDHSALETSTDKEQRDTTILFVLTSCTLEFRFPPSSQP